MIPTKTIEELITKHSTLEKELSSGNLDNKVFAEKSKLGYERLDGFANLNLIQEPSGVSSFKNINIKLELFSPENHVKAERLFNKVESQSMIVNSVTTKVDINWIIKE